MNDFGTSVLERQRRSPAFQRPRFPQLAAASVLWTVCLLSGCHTAFPPPTITLPHEIGDTAVHDRVVTPAEPAAIDLAATVVSPPEELLPLEAVAKPLAAPPELFTLPDAVDFALRNSPRLLSARAAIDRAQGQEQVAFAPFLPQLDMFTRYVATSPNLSPGAPSITGGVESTLTAETHSFAQTEFQLHYTLLDFGRRAGRYGQAVSQERIAQMQLARANQAVAFDVAAAYLQVLLTAAVRRVREESIQSAEATLKDTRARRQGGVADRDDVLRAEVQLSETREGLVNAREAEFSALARLNNVMGRNASLPIRLVDWKFRPAFPLSLELCLEGAVAQRPEVGITRAAVAYARYGRDATAAEFLPRVFLLGSLGRVDGENVLNGFQEGAGIHLEQGLYHGGQRRGELRAAEADIRQAVAAAQSVLDGISLEVTLAYHSVRATYERIDLSQTAIEQSRENLRLVRVKYRNGNATPTDIVDAETALTRSRQRYFSALYDYLAALARVDYAVGSPPGSHLQPAPNSPAPAPAPEPLPPPRTQP